MKSNCLKQTHLSFPSTLLLLLAWFAAAGSMFGQGTYFIDREADFSKLNDTSYNNFTITGGNITYDFRYASDYNSTAAIINTSDLQTFLNGGSTSAYSVFKDQFGVNRVTLGPGSYSVVMRNDANAANTNRFELDTIIDFSSDSTFYDYYIKGNEVVAANGGTLTQPFTIQSGFRYWLDGCNSGLEVYIIPADQLSNFTGHRTFTYYTDYSSPTPSTDLPGGYEIKLPPGDYDLVAYNSSGIARELQYDSSRWRITNGGSGGVGSGSAQFFNGAQYVGKGFYYLNFFGYYAPYQYPYIYHNELGYLYTLGAAGDNNDGAVYFYDFQGLNFLYTSRALYPYMYCFDQGAFLYYFKGTTKPRVFVNLTTGQYIYK